MFCSLGGDRTYAVAGTERTRRVEHWLQHSELLSMTAEMLIGLLEEMMDLKLQQYAEQNLKLNPEVSRLLHEKRDTDRRRLDQIRRELVRFLEA